MSHADSRVVSTVPPPRLVRLTHIIYLLHTFSVLMGILGPALIITAFLTGWPSIIAVIINYVKRDEVRDTYLDSHFGWQIRTFWYTLLWLVTAAMLFATVIGIPIAYVLVVGAGIWVTYRISAAGWRSPTVNPCQPRPWLPSGPTATRCSPASCTTAHLSSRTSFPCFRVPSFLRSCSASVRCRYVRPQTDAGTVRIKRYTHLQCLQRKRLKDWLDISI